MGRHHQPGRTQESTFGDTHTGWTAAAGVRPAPYSGPVPPQIRVILAEDDPLAQHAIQAYLSRANDMVLVGVASDGAEAVRLAEELTPDVAIVDLHRPLLDGIEVTSRITTGPLNCKVVCFTALGDDRSLIRAIEAGASGFLLKSDNPALILHGVRSAFSGDALVSPKMVASLLRNATTQHTPPPDHLTASDKDLLGHIGRGLSNAEIAEVMFLAPSTIKTYVSRLLSRLAQPNRAALAALAHTWGLVRL